MTPLRSNVGVGNLEARPGWLVPGGRMVPLAVAVTLPELQLFAATDTAGVRRASETAGVAAAVEIAGVRRA